MRAAALIGLLFLGLTAPDFASGQSSGTAQNANTATRPRVVERLEPWQDRALDAVTSRELTTFQSDAEFRRYLSRLGRIRNERRGQWRADTRLRPGQAYGLVQDAAAQGEVCSDPDTCPEEEGDVVVVTGTTIGPSAPITNVQTAGVDEGDVVKQIGDFLLVLQDGRIFSVNTRGDTLALADRIDVYRDADDDDAWYDEMLVEGNRVLITAYNYDQDATEISVFQVDPQTGALSRDGSFLISSEDYYDSDNYATRIIGDNLIIYTPYEADDFVDRSNRPRVRRWMSEAERDAMEDRGRDVRARGSDLIDADSIYRPVLRTVEPTIHTVTICPLGNYRATRVPNCRATAFVGPERAEMFVSPEAIYLWVGTGWGDHFGDGRGIDIACNASRPAFALIRPAAVYRVPVAHDEAVGVVGLRGRPFNQFSMDETRDTFRILVDQNDAACEVGELNDNFAYLNVPLSAFDAVFSQQSARRHIAVPAPGLGRLENRFAGDWLVYGGRRYGYGAIPDPANPADIDEDGRPDPIGHPVVILPVDHPDRAQTLTLDHNIIRIERVGPDRMAINGYRDDQGLSMSLLQLGGVARILDTARLPHRYESEGRSHAFNSTVAADGSGMIGVPTILRQGQARRDWRRSEGSDVSFLTMTAAGRLADAGALTQGQTEPQNGYRCEVSCIDWYGNSRPIFTGGRIFALMATEIAEGRLENGRIREIRRVDLTTAPPGRR